jgi:uncharacterized protein YneF (UPF0154 family)
MWWWVLGCVLCFLVGFIVGRIYQDYQIYRAFFDRW